MENARENPFAAAAAVSGAPPQQANAENLLDIDFDGNAPASAQKSPLSDMSGLEGLAGTPQRNASPAAADGPGLPPSGGGGNLDDLMGLSNGGGGGFGQQTTGMSNEDVLGGFASLDMNATNQPPPAGQQLQGGKKTNDDLLGLF